jgi:hypothetical protein
MPVHDTDFVAMLKRVRTKNQRLIQANVPISHADFVHPHEMSECSEEQLKKLKLAYSIRQGAIWGCCEEGPMEIQKEVAAQLSLLISMWTKEESTFLLPTFGWAEQINYYLGMITLFSKIDPDSSGNVEPAVVEAVKYLGDQRKSILADWAKHIKQWQADVAAEELKQIDSLIQLCEPIIAATNASSFTDDSLKKADMSGPNAKRLRAEFDEGKVLY